jgi:hypothetical protein
MNIVAFFVSSFFLSSLGFSENVPSGSRLEKPRIENFSSSTAVYPPAPTPGKAVRIKYQNDSLMGLPVKIHLGYNGWNLKVPGFTEVREGGDLSYHIKYPLYYDAKNQNYYIDVEVPAEARAIHYVFCWNECERGQWDNNNSSDYGWPIKFPYIGPFLTWNHTTPSTSGIVVSFEDPLSGAASLEYWSEKDKKRRVITDSPRKIHRFNLTQLSAGSTYFYRVKSRGFASETYSFRTHDGSRNVTFIGMSDTQNGGEWCAFPAIQTEIMQKHRDVDFILFAGDFLWNLKPGLWWTMFDSAREILGSKVIMPVPGNHDTPTDDSNSNVSAFRTYFDLPYVHPRMAHMEFEVGPAKFYGMDSENVAELEVGGEQYKWLEGKVKERNAKLKLDSQNWTFAYWHVPPINTGRRHPGQQYRLRPAAQLLAQVADLHFAGHEHIYQRSVPLDFRFEKQPEYGSGPGRGTGYIIFPSAGAWPEVGLGKADRSFLAFAGSDGKGNASGNGFTRVEIKGNELHMKTYQTFSPLSKAGIELVDQTWINKP